MFSVLSPSLQIRKGKKVEEGCRSGWRKISKQHHLRIGWGRKEFFTWRRASQGSCGRVWKAVCCVGAGFSIVSVAPEIKRLGWAEDRKTGWTPVTGSDQLLEVAVSTCACYCKLEVLLGGTPGFSSKSMNSWESNTWKESGCLESWGDIFQLKSTYFKDFITSRMGRGRGSTGIYKELTGRTRVRYFTDTFQGEEKPETPLQAHDRY